MIRIRVYSYQSLPEKEALVAGLGAPVADLLSRGRRGAALQETLLGFSLLAQMLPEIPLTAIRKSEKGRPFLSGYPEIDFNITHCKGLVACAVEEGDAPQIGLDAETLGTQTERSMWLIARRWFTPAEEACFEKTPTEETFLSLWTAKEAAAKYTGNGLGRFSEPNREETECRHYRVGDTILCAVCRKGELLPDEPEIADPI